MLLLKVEALPGASVEKTIAEMLSLQSKLEMLITCRFNGVDLTAYAGSTPSSMYVDYQKALEVQEQRLGVK